MALQRECQEPPPTFCPCPPAGGRRLSPGRTQGWFRSEPPSYTERGRGLIQDAAGKVPDPRDIVYQGYETVAGAAGQVVYTAAGAAEQVVNTAAGAAGQVVNTAAGAAGHVAHTAHKVVRRVGEDIGLIEPQPPSYWERGRGFVQDAAAKVGIYEKPPGYWDRLRNAAGNIREGISQVTPRLTKSGSPMQPQSPVQGYDDNCQTPDTFNPVQGYDDNYQAPDTYNPVQGYDDNYQAPDRYNPVQGYGDNCQAPDTYNPVQGYDDNYQAPDTYKPVQGYDDNYQASDTYNPVQGYDDNCQTPDTFNGSPRQTQQPPTCCPCPPAGGRRLSPGRTQAWFRSEPEPPPPNYWERGRGLIEDAAGKAGIYEKPKPKGFWDSVPDPRDIAYQGYETVAGVAEHVAHTAHKVVRRVGEDIGLIEPQPPNYWERGRGLIEDAAAKAGIYDKPEPKGYWDRLRTTAGNIREGLSQGVPRKTKSGRPRQTQSARPCPSPKETQSALAGPHKRKKPPTGGPDLSPQKTQARPRRRKQARSPHRTQALYPPGEEVTSQPDCSKLIRNAVASFDKMETEAIEELKIFSDEHQSMPATPAKEPIDHQWDKAARNPWKTPASHDKEPKIPSKDEHVRPPRKDPTPPVKEPPRKEPTPPAKEPIESQDEDEDDDEDEDEPTPPVKGPIESHDEDGDEDKDEDEDEDKPADPPKKKPVKESDSDKQIARQPDPPKEKPDSDWDPDDSEPPWLGAKPPLLESLPPDPRRRRMPPARPGDAGPMAHGRSSCSQLGRVESIICEYNEFENAAAEEVKNVESQREIQRNLAAMTG